MNVFRQIRAALPPELLTAPLPCDVAVDSKVIVRAGCTVETLLVTLTVRADKVAGA